MAYYLVTAKPKKAKLEQLKARLEAGKILKLRPFGKALDDSLRRARYTEAGLAVWEENDYCSPPLAMERAAVLDDYFSAIEVEEVRKGEGWTRLEGLPSLWKL